MYGWVLPKSRRDIVKMQLTQYYLRRFAYPSTQCYISRWYEAQSCPYAYAHTTNRQVWGGVWVRACETEYMIFIIQLLWQCQRVRLRSVLLEGDLNEIESTEIGDQTDLFLHNTLRIEQSCRLENAAYFREIRSTPRDESDHNTATYPFVNKTAHLIGEICLVLCENINISFSIVHFNSIFVRAHSLTTPQILDQKVVNFSSTSVAKRK